MLVEVKECFIREFGKTREFLADEESYINSDSLKTVAKASSIAFVALGLTYTISFTDMFPIGANLAAAQAEDNIYLPIIARNSALSPKHPGSPEIHGYLKFVPERSQYYKNVWEWGALINDPDNNLEEFCRITSEQPRKCTSRPDGIKQWDRVSAKGYIYHTSEIPCASIKVEAIDSNENETVWSKEKCLP